MGVKGQMAILGGLSAVLLSVPFLVPHCGWAALFGLVPLLCMEKIGSETGVKRLWFWYYGVFVLWNALTTFWVCNATVGGGIFAVLANALQMAVIFALFLYKKPFSMFRVAMAELTTGLLCSMLLNTLWLSILYKTPYLTTFMARLPKELVMLPINILIICLVSKAVHGLAEHFLEPVRSRKQ